HGDEEACVDRDAPKARDRSAVDVPAAGLRQHPEADRGPEHQRGDGVADDQADRGGHEEAGDQHTERRPTGRLTPLRPPTAWPAAAARTTRSPTGPRARAGSPPRAG